MTDATLPDFVSACLAARADAAHPDHADAMSVEPAALATVRWVPRGRGWRCETCGGVLHAVGDPTLRTTVQHYCARGHWCASHLADDLRAGVVPLWPAARLFAQGCGYEFGADAARVGFVEADDLLLRARTARRTTLAAQLATVIALAGRVAAGEPIWLAGRGWPARVAHPGVYAWVSHRVLAANVLDGDREAAP